MTKPQLLQELRGLLGEMLIQYQRGASGHELARKQGLVDGYMLALMDSGLAGRHELLTLVERVRGDVLGPATTRHREMCRVEVRAGRGGQTLERENAAA